LGSVLLILLAVLWAAAVAPPILRARSQHRSRDDLSEYCRSLSKLGGPMRRTGAPSSPYARAARRRAAQRRRRTFAWLAGATGASLLFALASGSRRAWLVSGFVFAALLAYTALVAHFQRGAAIGRQLRRPAYVPPAPAANVAYLPARVPQRVAAPMALRRSVGS
jgi:hypothetical protein